MAFWNKKEVQTKVVEKDPVVEIPIPKCFHTWKDFPAYIKEKYENGKSILEVVEPYICVHCKERENVSLYTETETGLSRSEHDKKREDWEYKYRKILQPRIIVEDMINDEIRLDPIKLAIIEKLRGAKNEEEQDESSQLNIPPDAGSLVPAPSNKTHKRKSQTN